MTICGRRGAFTYIVYLAALISYKDQVHLCDVNTYLRPDLTGYLAKYTPGKKEAVHHKEWNKIASQRFFTTKFSTDYHCPPLNSMQLILCRFRPMVMLCEHSCEINTLYPCKLTSVCSLWLLSQRCSVGFGVSERHIYWFVAICCLSVWHADTSSSFTSYWDHRSMTPKSLMPTAP